MKISKKYDIGIVSGYFNPIHQGHLEYFNAAKDQCKNLIVIVNNDYQVSLKGSKPFMDENHRSIIVNNIKSVNKTIISIDKDKSVCETIKLIKRL
jgi:cytidyltransferase-like protein